MSLSDSHDILFEDNHCLALNKPNGWPTTHYAGKEETFDRWAKAYLKEKYQKPGQVFLGVVHRLDKPVSGVVLFARTSKAAARLSEQFRNHAIEKTYWGVVEGRPGGESTLAGTFDDWLIHRDDEARVEVVAGPTAEAKRAVTHFEVRRQHQRQTLIELRPQTGRKHQLRVQLAHRGTPIWGDRKYGSPHLFGNGIALHARSLTFLHPTRNEPITVTAEVPPLWRARFANLLAPTMPR